jgi:membrane fusion protein, multidrug efflux system
MDGSGKIQISKQYRYCQKTKTTKSSTMKYCILFIFLAALFIACSSDVAENQKPEPAKKTGTDFQLATLQKNGVASFIKLPAQLAAYEEVSIFPKVNGYVKTVRVDIGSRVKKGDLLMVLEAPELEQAVSQAKEKYARTKADFSIDREHYLRLLEASETAGAISPLDLSTLRSKVEADSALCNAEKSNWQMQETMQGYLKVQAPFDGMITERNVHPGALVSAEAKDAKPMLELKQISHLRLEVDVPENIAGSLRDKDTVSFYTSAFPGKKMTGFISRKSMNVEPQFRSERMEIDVFNKEAVLTPGMYADVVLYNKGNANALTAPASAIVTSTERKYILLIKNGITVKADVTTGNESGNKIEVYGNIRAGDTVIAHASEDIKEGLPVSK